MPFGPLTGGIRGAPFSRFGIGGGGGGGMLETGAGAPDMLPFIVPLPLFTLGAIMGPLDEGGGGGGGGMFCGGA